MANSNNYVEVASTTNAHDTRIEPEVFQDLMWAGPDDPSVAALFDTLMGAQGTARTRVKNQKFLSFHEWPNQVEITVTADATAGSNVTISVDDSTYVRNNSRIWATENEELFTVNQNPSTSTTIRAATLSNNLSAGDTLIVGWEAVGESWSRPVPQSRNTDHHYDYVSTLQEAVACSWHNKNTGRYGEDEYARIDRRMTYEFKQKKNRALIFSEPVDGTSTGTYEMAGLYYMGKTYNRYVMPSVATRRALFNVEYTMRKYGHAKNLVWLMGQRLSNEFALANSNNSVITQNQNMTDGTYGAVAPKIVTPTPGVTSRILIDETFDNRGMDDKIILFNLDLIDPVQFGDTLLQKPSSANPQGVADVGTGDMMSMITQTCGIRYRLPHAAVALIDNVNRVTP